MIPAAGTVFVVDDNAAVLASLRTLFGAAAFDSLDDRRDEVARAGAEAPHASMLSRGI